MIIFGLVSNDSKKSTFDGRTDIHPSINLIGKRMLVNNDAQKNRTNSKIVGGKCIGLRFNDANF